MRIVLKILTPRFFRLSRLHRKAMRRVHRAYAESRGYFGMEYLRQNCRAPEGIARLRFLPVVSAGNRGGLRLAHSAPATLLTGGPVTGGYPGTGGYPATKVPEL